MKKIKVTKRLLINFLLFGFISFPAYSNENINNIFFKVVSKDKIIDVDGDEACLTKFEVTNNSIYTLYLEEPFLFGIAPKRYKWGDESGDLVNPNLEENEVEAYDYINYFESGMSANIVGYETSMDYGEHSSVISYTKCKRIKTYVIKLSCEVINADTVLDINEDNIQWDSNKKAYKTILNLLDSHPEHDESMGKFKFDKKYSC